MKNKWFSKLKHKLKNKYNEVQNYINLGDYNNSDGGFSSKRITNIKLIQEDRNNPPFLINISKKNKR